MFRPRLLLSFVLLAAVCGPRDLIRRVMAHDYALVREGFYQGGGLRVDSHDPRLLELSAGWRKQIDSDTLLVRDIARKYFSIPEETRFRFMYVGEDSARKRIVLRYFGYAPKPFIFAGWQVQFVFDAGTKLLRAVLTSEVPLEG